MIPTLALGGSFGGRVPAGGGGGGGGSGFALTAGPVSNVAGGASNTISVTLSGCTVGNSIVCGVAWLDNTSTVSSITCSGEGNLTVHGSPLTSSSGPTSTQWASLAQITASGDKTLTLTISASAFKPGIWAFEVSGGDVADFFEAAHGSTGNSTNPTTTVDTVAGGALVVGFAYQFNGNPTSVGPGYTVINTNLFDSYHDLGEYNLDAGTAGTKTVDFVCSTGPWLCNAAAFNRLA